MICLDISESVGQYISNLITAELSTSLRREPYKDKEGDTNHRNGSYDRHFTLKGIDQVKVEVPIYYPPAFISTKAKHVS